MEICDFNSYTHDLEQEQSNKTYVYVFKMFYVKSYCFGVDIERTTNNQDD